MDDLSYWKNPLDFFKKAGPGALFFICALILMFVGALVPALAFLYKTGLLVFGIFFVIWIVWLIFNLNGL